MLHAKERQPWSSNCLIVKEQASNLSKQADIANQIQLDGLRTATTTKLKCLANKFHSTTIMESEIAFGFRRNRYVAISND